MSIITTHSLAAVPSAHRNDFIVLAKVRRALNGWVAAYLAHAERRATAWALSALNERELKDFGTCRAHALAPADKRRMATS